MSKELSERQSNKLLENEEYLPIGTVVTIGDGTKINDYRIVAN